MLVAADTNVFGYAEGGDDARKAAIAKLWLNGMDGSIVMPTQVAGELYNVLTRKFGCKRAVAVDRINRWKSATLVMAPSISDMDDALALAANHDFQIWDALILVISATADCRVLLSEDMHEGFVYRGVTIANPFAATLHPLLASLLDSLPPMSPPVPQNPAGAP